MNFKNTDRLYILLFTLFLFSCNTQNSRIEISGKWQVAKAEVDGYSITDEYTHPHESWIYFNEDGTLLGGKEMSEFSGKWRKLSGSRLFLTSSSPKWNNTMWKFSVVDSVLYLKGTKLTNNFTRKLWFKPAGKEIPPFRLTSAHDKRLAGTWNLLRIKRNSKLISPIGNDNISEKVQITFLETGIYQSNLPGEDQLAGYGVWNLDEYDLKLSLFPFNTPDRKSWDYSFAGDLLRLSSLEDNGKSTQRWEWVWQKSADPSEKL